MHSSKAMAMSTPSRSWAWVLDSGVIMRQLPSRGARNFAPSSDTLTNSLSEKTW